jgi:hypothetical protein
LKSSNSHPPILDAFQQPRHYAAALGACARYILTKQRELTDPQKRATPVAAAPKTLRSDEEEQLYIVQIDDKSGPAEKEKN